MPFGHLYVFFGELIYKTETELQIPETNLWLPKGKCGWDRGINQEFGMNAYTLLYMFTRLSW